MNFLKSAGAALFKTGPNVCANIGERELILQGSVIPWALHTGTHKTTGENVSIFIWESNQHSNEWDISAARNFIRKLKILKHPGFLQYVDSSEPQPGQHGQYVVVTHHVTPLYAIDKTSDAKRMVPWGLYNVLRAVSFLNSECNMLHGCLGVSAVFVDDGGGWRLGGVELTSSTTDQSPVFAEAYRCWQRGTLPPEIAQISVPNPTSFMNEHKPGPIDAWGCGCLIYEVFNGKLESPSQLGNFGSIPSHLTTIFKKMLGSNPARRALPAEALNNTFFQDEVVRVGLFISELALKEEDDKVRFFKHISGTIDQLPKHFTQSTLLPEMVKAVEFGGIATAALPALLCASSTLDPEVFLKVVLPCIRRSFSSQDRSLRLALLNNLDKYISHLDNSVVEKDIIKPVMAGFQDSLPAMRDATIKSMAYLSPKLSEKTVTDSVMKALGSAQGDSVSSVRVNSIICIGKVAVHMTEGAQEKTVMAACARALKDSFVPSRKAGLAVLSAWADKISANSSANLCTPVATAVLDENSDVRSAALSAMRSLMKRLESEAEILDAKAPLELENPSDTLHMQQDHSTNSSVNHSCANSFTYTAQATSNMLPSTSIVTDGIMDDNDDAWGQLDVSIEQPSAPAKTESTLKSARTSKATSLTPQRSNLGSSSAVDDDGWGDLDGWGSSNDVLQSASSPKQAGKKSGRLKLGTVKKPANDMIDWD